MLQIGRLLHIDDHERIVTYQQLLGRPVAPAVDGLPVREARLLHMLVAALGDQALTRKDTIQDAVDLVWTHPQVREELQQLLDVLGNRVDHLHDRLSTHPEVPLQFHAR